MGGVWRVGGVGGGWVGGGGGGGGGGTTLFSWSAIQTGLSRADRNFT